MDTTEILRAFDEQMRRRPAPEGLFVGKGWSAVLWWPGEGDVDALVARMRELPGHVEWKYYSHDGPELRGRLVAAGLEPEDEETVVVAEAASIPPPPEDVELRVVNEEFVELAHGVFGGRRFDLPEKAVAVVAIVDGKAAGLFGGVTLEEFRGRGLYRATVARRAELAREAGYRWLYVDALPTSRPILERNGFVAITTTTPFVIPDAAD